MTEEIDENQIEVFAKLAKTLPYPSMTVEGHFIEVRGKNQVLIKKIGAAWTWNSVVKISKNSLRVLDEKINVAIGKKYMTDRYKEEKEFLLIIQRNVTKELFMEAHKIKLQNQIIKHYKDLLKFQAKAEKCRNGMIRRYSDLRKLNTYHP
jgi:hypothetical protein